MSEVTIDVLSCLVGTPAMHDSVTSGCALSQEVEDLMVLTLHRVVEAGCVVTVGVGAAPVGVNAALTAWEVACRDMVVCSTAK